MVWILPGNGLQRQTSSEIDNWLLVGNSRKLGRISSPSILFPKDKSCRDSSEVRVRFGNITNIR